MNKEKGISRTVKNVKNDAVFTLATNTDVTDIEVIHKIEQALDDCLLQFGLCRTGTTKGKETTFFYQRVAFRP